MSTGLSGTGLVADDLYLLAHHEVSGKPFLQPRALGLGLAGGLLAELMLLGVISIRQEGVVAGRTPPEEGLARHVLSLLASERQSHPVRDWLLFMARTAAEDVARRLERSGYVTRAGGRGPLRAGRWVPVDADCAFAPLLRVRAALDPARPLPARGAALAGLATACGLGYRLAQYAPSKTGRSLEEAVWHLGPGLRELIAQTQAAVDSALLSHRV
jgi:Golgi phosphoprotein 3 (GPP34)